MEQVEKYPLKLKIGGYVLCARREQKSPWHCAANVFLCCVADCIFFELVVRRDFAVREKLESIKAVDADRASSV